MERSLALILLLFFSASVYAVDLCEAECRVLIDFPEGGRLHAVEQLTITFGDNGLIDTIESSIAHVKGDTLTLNAGESINFGVGGSFDLGDAGNIAYTSMEISTSGDIQFIAVGGEESIRIEVLTIIGQAEFMVDAKMVIINVLSMEDGVLQLDAAGDEGGTCSTPSGGGVMINSVSLPRVIHTSASCDLLAGQLTLPDGFFTRLVLEVHSVSVEEPDNTGKNETGDSRKGSVSFFYFFMLILSLPLLHRRRR